MKLSEAIRDGAKLRPQKRGHFFGFVEHDKWGSCALGGAFECHFGGPHFDEHHMTKALREAYPILDVDVVVPGRGTYHTDLRMAIMILNDNCKWSREAIAEWVETIEKKLEAQATPARTELPCRVEAAQPVVQTTSV